MSGCIVCGRTDDHGHTVEEIRAWEEGPVRYRELTTSEVREMSGGSTLEELGWLRAVEIDEELLGGSVMDGRNVIAEGEDGQWFWPGSSNIRYASIEDYIARNQPEA